MPGKRRVGGRIRDARIAGLRPRASMADLTPEERTLLEGRTLCLGMAASDRSHQALLVWDDDALRNYVGTQGMAKEGHRAHDQREHLMGFQRRGILLDGYPLSLSSLLPAQRDGLHAMWGPIGLDGVTLMGYGEYVMARHPRGYVLFWGPIEAHRVFNRDRPAEDASWHEYRLFSPDQRREIGWIAPTERDG